MLQHMMEHAPAQRDTMSQHSDRPPTPDYALDDFLTVALFIADMYSPGFADRRDALQQHYGISIKHTFIFNAIVEKSLLEQQQTILHVVQEQQCAAIVIDALLDFPPELLLALREHGVLCIAGNILATMPPEPGALIALARYDACLTTDQATSEALSRLGVTPLFEPIPLDRGLHAQPVSPQADRPIGLMFVGSVWGSEHGSQQRIAALAFLRAQGIKVCCLGSGFECCRAFSGYGNASLSSQAPVGDVENPVACLQQAAIGIAFADSPEVRFLQILLAGALLLCPDTPLVRRYLTPGQEVVTFSSLDELAAHGRFYLEHDEERLAIAYRGFAKAHQCFRHDRLLQAARKRIGDALSPSKANRRLRCLRARLLPMLLESNMTPGARRAAMRPLLQAYGAPAVRQVLEAIPAALPQHLRLPAVTVLEDVLLSAVTVREKALAEVLVSVCLQFTICHSPSLVLACALDVYKKRPEALAPVIGRYGVVIDALSSLVSVTGTTDDPFFDDMYIKQRLRDCAGQRQGIALFGTGSNGQAWADWIRRELPAETLSFVDNDPQKQHTTIHGLPVLAPDDLAGHAFGCIVVTSDSWEQIRVQLISRGYRFPQNMLLAKGRPPMLHGLRLQALPLR
jgi:hypothetical protein